MGKRQRAQIAMIAFAQRFIRDRSLAAMNDFHPRQIIGTLAAMLCPRDQGP
jgi:hypothetical protein